MGRSVCFVLMLLFFTAFCTTGLCAQTAEDGSWAGAKEYEAEAGVLMGKAGTGNAGSQAAYVQGLESDGDGVEVTVSAQADGFYDINVYSASMDGNYKENYVLVDGEQLGVVGVKGKKFTDAVLERAYMSKGEHRITVKKFWGWIRIDKIKIKPSPELPAGLFDVEPVLVNPNASDNARRLMTYLADNYGKKVLSGQYCDGGMYGIENACIWKAAAGAFPAILGLDMIEYSPSRQSHGSSSKTVEHALEYWDKGGIVTLCWHWNAPEKYLTDTWYKGFYKEYTSIDLNAIMEGRDQEGYALLLSDISVIAMQLKRLCDADVPILWRPLHEAAGGWFWWGSAGPEAYIKLYRLLYDELTCHYGLSNLIWVWNGQGKEWYPGDGYVDIIGEDIYPGEHVYTPQSARFVRALQ